MLFRSVATAIVAAYGLVVLRVSRGSMTPDQAAEAARAFYGTKAEAAASFRIVFLCTACTFSISLLSLLFMEEKPLMTERRRS